MEKRTLLRWLIVSAATVGVAQAHAEIQPTPGGGERNQPGRGAPVHVQPDRSIGGSTGDTSRLPPTSRGSETTVAPVLRTPGRAQEGERFQERRGKTRRDRREERLRTKPRTGRTKRTPSTEEPSRLGQGIRAGDHRGETRREEREETRRGGRVERREERRDDRRPDTSRANDVTTGPSRGTDRNVANPERGTTIPNNPIENRGSAERKEPGQGGVRTGSPGDVRQRPGTEVGRGQKVSLQRRVDELKPVISQRRTEIRRVRDENKVVFEKDYVTFRDSRTQWLQAHRIEEPRGVATTGTLDRWSDSYSRLMAEDPIIETQQPSRQIRWSKPMPEERVLSYPNALVVAENIEALARDVFDSASQAQSEETQPLLNTLKSLVAASISYTDSVQKHDEWTESLSDLFALDQAVQDTEMRLKDDKFAQDKIGDEVKAIRSAVNRLLLTYKKYL